MKNRPLLLLSAPLALAACGQPVPAPQPTPSERVPPATAPRPAQTAAPERAYLGRWIGVEGMFLDVRKAQGGGVTLEMQWDLDHRGSFPGSVTAEGLRFMRNGVAEVAVPGNGDQTGLKWLAGEEDCLIVKPGEGYCRA